MEEAPVVARLRERIARIFSYVEDVMYVGVAALLALSALVLLGTAALTLGRSVAGGVLPASIIGLLDQLLLVLLIIELLYTVHVSFREHVLTAPPFLLVALIAAVRCILVLTGWGRPVWKDVALYAIGGGIIGALLAAVPDSSTSCRSRWRGCGGSASTTWWPISPPSEFSPSASG